MASAGQRCRDKTFLLNNGVQMPAVGMSTFRARSEPVVYKLIDTALSHGYRMFDTSSLFCNEVSLRNAFAHLLPKYRLERKDIFIISKLVSLEEGATIRSSIDMTLLNLGSDYVDMYLLSSSIQSSINLRQAWHELRTVQMSGLTKSIGVANFSPRLIRYIMEDSITPAVNQVEWHPLHSSDALYSFCLKNNIALQAYAPFGTPFAKHKSMFQDPLIRQLSLKYEVPASQILLMWSLQQKVGVLPSTTNTEHLKENIDFELMLTPSDVDLITALAPDSDNDSD